MIKTSTFSLDEETIQMLKRQAERLHLSKSALIRLLLVKNDRENRSHKGGVDVCD